MTDRIRFYRKFMACLILSLLLLGTVLLLGHPPRPEWIPEIVVFGCALLGLIIPLAILPVWEFRERRKLVDTSSIFTRMQAWIAYLTGFGISLFGWDKLFKLQFRVPLSIADLPMSQFSFTSGQWE
jgi:hypothetical protein